MSPAVQQQPPAIVPITQVSPHHTLGASCVMHPPVTTASKLPPNVHPVTPTSHVDNVQRKTDRPCDLINLEQELLKISRPRKWPVVSSPPLSTSTPVMPQTMLMQTAQGVQFMPLAPSPLSQTSLPLVQMQQSPDMQPVQYVHSVPDAALLSNSTSIGQTLSYDLSMLTTPSSVMPTFEQTASVPDIVGTAPESELNGAEKTLISQAVGTIGHGAKLAQTLMAQTTVVSATKSTLVSSAVVSSVAVKSVAPTVKAVPVSAMVTPQLVPSQVVGTDVLGTPVTTPNPVKKSRFSVTIVNEDPLVDKLKQTKVSETRLDEPSMPVPVVPMNERSTVKTIPNSTACTSIEVLKTPKVIRKGRFKVMTFHDNSTTGEVTATVPVTTQETKQPPSNSTSQESLGNLTDGDSITSVTSVCLPRQLSDSGVSTTSECSIENRSTTSQTVLDAILTGSIGQMTRPVVAAMTPESLGSQTPANNLMSLVHHEMSLLKQETQAKVHSHGCSEPPLELALQEIRPTDSGYQAIILRHQKELSALKMRHRQEIHTYLMQQHSQRHRVSRAAQDLSGATPMVQKDSGGPVPLTTSMSTFDNFISAPWMVPIAPQQHMMIPAVSVQHAVQSIPVMFPDTEQTVYSTAANQELLPVAAAVSTSDTMLRQPTGGKPAEAYAVPVVDDSGVSCQQLPDYFVEAHVYPDHVTSEKVVEPSHVRKESDGGLYLQEVNSGASVQVPRLKSASLTPHGSPVMQHKQSHVTPVTSTSLAGFTPSMMLQPKVLPAFAPMPSLTPQGHYIIAQHQMLQMLQQQQQLQQYGLQNTTPPAVSQIQLPPQQQRAGFVIQQSQQKQPSQFLQQPSLRSQVLDANTLASYMVSQQYQQMALSSAVPPSWLYLPSVAPMPAGQPQFTPGVVPASQPAGFIPANPVPAARLVMTQSAPMIPVSQPTTSVPVATVPPVTSGT